MATIQVIWSTAAGAYEGGDVTSRTFEFVPGVEDGVGDLGLCEQAFCDTNTYCGPMWDAMQPLPDDRTHTSLSVGDYVVIDDRMYRCSSVGWERTDEFVPGLRFQDRV